LKKLKKKRTNPKLIKNYWKGLMEELSVYLRSDW